MDAVHNEKPAKEVYRAAIERMLKNIHDEKRLKLIYKYIVYLYTRSR